MQVLLWWALVTALGATLAPFVLRVFPGFPDRGLAFARPLAIVLLGLAAWTLGAGGLAYGVALAAGLAGLVAIGGACLILGGRGSWPERRELARSETAFAAALLAFSALRTLRPEIFGAEKYMDFAFFNAILRSDEIPPTDPWLAGHPIHYYYFGYLLCANLARLSGLAPEIAYNLALATIAATLFAGAVSIGRVLSRRIGLAWLGGLAAVVLGNFDGARQVLLEGRAWTTLDYWRSSRVVPNTINEFPFFAVLHGDLHPHVTSLLVLVPLIAVLLSAARSDDVESASPRGLERLPLAVACALLAALALTNPWDVPLALGLLSLLAVWRRFDVAAPLRSLARVAVPVGAALITIVVWTLPFRTHFTAPVAGIGRVHAFTALGDALVLFGLFLVPAAIALAVAIREILPERAEIRHFCIAVLGFSAAVIATSARSVVLACTVIAIAGAVSLLLDRERNRELGAATALVAVALVAIATCEVVYLRDSYGAELHRMNTVFKFYFQAWIYFALAWPGLLSAIADRLPTSLERRASAVLLAAMAAAALVYPIAATATFAVSAPRPLSLDGLDYLRRKSRGEVEVIHWLRDNAAPESIVLEATGDAYSEFARMASNTGIPTLLGWANHERVWRGNAAVVATREALVRRLYDEPDAATASRILRDEGIDLVVVGDLERRTYSPVGLAKFADAPELFPEAFRADGVVVFATGATPRTSASSPASETTTVRSSSNAMPSGNPKLRENSAIPRNLPAPS